MFEELWNKGIDAKDRIRDIEQGTDLADRNYPKSKGRDKLST